MFKQIQKLLGSKKSHSGSISQTDESNFRELTDSDREFLFNQLLEGVVHGWHQGKILKFFDQLQEKGQQDLWITWLERFGKNFLNSDAANHQLSARMIRFGQVAQSIPKIKKFATLTGDLGQQWLNKHAGLAIWEYDGPDSENVYFAEEDVEYKPIDLESNLPGTTNILDEDSVEFNTNASSEQEVKTLTLDELFTLLQEQPELTTQIASQLGIDTDNPETIVETLLQQLKNNSPEVLEETEIINNDVETWFNLGLQQAEAGDMSGAIASWNKSLAIDPNLSSAWHNRGSALGYLGQFEEALESFDRALALEPQDYQAWNDRGNALYNLKQWQEALESWDKTIEIEPNYYQAWYNRACALESLNRTEESILSYNKSLEIKPDFGPAKNRRDELLTKMSLKDT
jgi:tetratricopeptide (TPR) repeat protein